MQRNKYSHKTSVDTTTSLFCWHPGDQRGITSGVLILAGLTYVSENLLSVSNLSTALGCGNPALLHLSVPLLLGPALVASLDLLMAMADRGPGKQNPVYKPVSRHYSCQVY